MSLRRVVAPLARAGPPGPPRPRARRRSAGAPGAGGTRRRWRAGLTPERGPRRGPAAFGGIEQMKEAHRDDRSARWIENVVRDMRYGLAALGRDPVFTLVAIGVLALGIGANTAMFSLVDGVLFKPLPFPAPGAHRARLGDADRRPPPTPRRPATSSSSRQQSRSFEALSAESLSTATVDGQRRADAAERPLRVGGSLRRVRRAAADRPHVPAPTKTSRAPIASSS